LPLGNHSSCPRIEGLNVQKESLVPETAIALEASEAQRRRVVYATLARELSGDLLRLARRFYVGMEDQAQDLVQEALLRGYQAYLSGGFREGSNARAWLMRILTNVYLGELRHTRRWDAGVDVETLTAGGEAGPSATHTPREEQPDAALLRGTLDEPLERALAALPEERRLCVLLVDLQELDYESAAAALGIPIGTLRSRLARARVQLHNLLVAYGREHRLL
jgi:RNA polymerase sigma-70 factor (ECF subfamily)